jgi:hypothetical protein
MALCRFTNGTAVPTVDVPSRCAPNPPATTIRCPRCEFCEDQVQHQNCSSHGTCIDGACACTAGWTGAICDLSSQTCTTGVRDTAGVCCMSGLVAEGRCCEGAWPGRPMLDRDGACCASGVVDACGICDGVATSIDVTGNCCSVRSCWPLNLFAAVLPMGSCSDDAATKAAAGRAAPRSAPLMTSGQSSQEPCTRKGSRTASRWHADGCMPSAWGACTQRVACPPCN